MAKRRTYRVNADSIDTLIDILVATPDDFNNPYRDKLYGYATLNPRRGRLSEDDYRAMRNADVEYVIYSYGTPIAYWERTISPNRVKADNGRTVGYSNWRWVMPNGPRSNTTAKHVAKVTAALKQISGGL